jgi:drug/metabolite transporter (DMT)-like permease
MAGEATNSEVRRGRLLLLGAALLWSTSGFFLKSPPLASLPDETRGPVLACYRALFAAAFLIPFVRPRSVRFRPMLIPMAISFASMNFLFVTAMTRTTAAAAIFLQYTSTVWAFLFGFVFLKERVDRGNLIALVCALAGIVWIVAAEQSSAHFTGNLIALASGLAYAGVMLSLRSLRGEDAAWLIALNHIVSGLVLLPWVLTLHVSLDGRQWLLVALLGILQMALPYVLFARGVRTMPTQEAALLTLIEPILNPLWVWIFWGEHPGTATCIGGGLILGGLAIRYLLFPARQQNA